MVSDVIAYPERTVEMVDEWCREKRAGAMVVTMKFQGDQGPTLRRLRRRERRRRRMAMACEMHAPVQQ